MSEKRRRLMLPPELTDGVATNPCLPGEFDPEWLRDWLYQAEDGDVLVLSWAEMSDAEVEALPEL